jgi:hypothetical protein
LQWLREKVRRDAKATNGGGNMKWEKRGRMTLSTGRGATHHTNQHLQLLLFIRLVSKAINSTENRMDGG